MNRGELTTIQWERLHPLLPPQKPKTGRPAHDQRPIINGLWWLLRTGAPWRDLPERYDPWRTVASRFYRWQPAGLWRPLVAAGPAQAEAHGQRHGAVHGIEGPMIRAHRHAAGAKNGTQSPKPSAAAGGGFRTTVHLRAEGGGQLMTLVLTPGQRHEAVVLTPLMETGAVKRRGPGRPKRRPQRVIGDTGDRSGKSRQYARQQGMRITIPRPQNDRRTGPCDRALSRLRNRLERLINRCTQCRRLATRSEQRAVYDQALGLIAATI